MHACGARQRRRSARRGSGGWVRRSSCRPHGAPRRHQCRRRPARQWVVPSSPPRRRGSLPRRQLPSHRRSLPPSSPPARATSASSAATMARTLRKAIFSSSPVPERMDLFQPARENSLATSHCGGGGCKVCRTCQLFRSILCPPPRPVFSYSCLSLSSPVIWVAGSVWPIIFRRLLRAALEPRNRNNGVR